MFLVCSPWFSVGIFVFLCFLLGKPNRDMDAQMQNGFHPAAVLLDGDFDALTGQQVWLLFGQFWPNAAI